jgi:hypothetical protein
LFVAHSVVSKTQTVGIHKSNYKPRRGVVVLPPCVALKVQTRGSIEIPYPGFAPLTLHPGKEILRPIRGFMLCMDFPTVCDFVTTLWATNN